MVYLSAAGVAEPAVDVDHWAREMGQKTIDNKDHGAFTNILLHAFNYNLLVDDSAMKEKSPADENNDGQLTAGELHQYIRRELRKRSFSQTPNLLTPSDGRSNELTGGKAWSDVPLFCFSRKKLLSQNIEKRASENFHSIKVWRGNISSNMVKNLDAVSGIEMLPKEKKKDAELIINEEQDGYALYFPNGNFLTKILSTNNLKKRIVRQLFLKRFEELGRLPKKYGVMAEIIGSSGVYFTGMDMGIALHLESESYVLVFDITPQGLVNIIWPYEISELKKIQGLSYPGLTTLTGKDNGTEMLVAIAYYKKPSFWDRVLEQAKNGPDDAFLEEVIKSAYGSDFSGASVDYAFVVGRDLLGFSTIKKVP